MQDGIAETAVEILAAQPSPASAATRSPIPMMVAKNAAKHQGRGRAGDATALSAQDE
jgi:hypothetical protein